MSTKKTRVMFPFMGLILLTLISAQRSLLSDDLRDLLHESLSGERAKDHVIQITRHNRIQGSRGYRNAAQYVLQQLRRSGAYPARRGGRMERYPLDSWLFGSEPRGRRR